MHSSRFLSFLYDDTLWLVEHVNVLEALHSYLIAQENAPNFFDLLYGNFEIISLLEDESLQLHIRELFVEALEELLRLFEDLVGKVDETIAH